MKAKEFRIGNLYSQFGNVHEVTWVTIKELEKAPVEQLWCKPIQLTEDWLLKTDLILSDDSGDIKYFDIPNTKYFICLDHDDVSFGFYPIMNNKTEIIILEWWSLGIPVHQFQNLYFALTGQELAIVNPIP